MPVRIIFTIIKGAPSARHAGRPWPCSRRMRRPRTESVNERGSAAPQRPGVLGTLAAGGGAAWPASSCAIAHRRGPLPTAPMPRTPPQRAPRRNAPWACAPRAGRAGCRAPGVPIAGLKGHKRRAGTPRIVRVGPSTRKGTRRSFLTASQKASSGPTLARGATADPAGLTARARPKARPD
jgi:hypothetical protein